MLDLFMTLTLYYARAIFLMLVFLLSVSYAYEGFKIIADVNPKLVGKSVLYKHLISLLILVFIDFMFWLIFKIPLHSWTR